MTGIGAFLLGCTTYGQSWEFGLEAGTGVRNPYTDPLHWYDRVSEGMEHSHFVYYIGGYFGLSGNDTAYHYLRIGVTNEASSSHLMTYNAGNHFNQLSEKAQTNFHVAVGSKWNVAHIGILTPQLGAELSFSSFGEYTDDYYSITSDSVSGSTIFHRVDVDKMDGGTGIALGINLGADLRISNSVKINVAYLPSATWAKLGGSRTITRDYVVMSSPSQQDETIITESNVWRGMFFTNQLLVKLIYKI